MLDTGRILISLPLTKVNQMRSTVIALSSLLILTASFQACGKGNSSKKPGPQRSRYFTHGNPEELIAGSALDSKSFLKLDELKQYQDLQLIGVFSFSQRSPRKEYTGWNEVEKENSTEQPDDPALENEPILWRFEKQSEDLYTLRESRGSKPSSFSFRLKDGALELEAMNGLALKVLHYSLKSDKKALSFLFTVNDPEFGQTLSAVSFATLSKEAKEPERIGNFSFLFGNYAIKWPGAITIEASGPLPEASKNTIRQSLAAWFPNLPDAKTQGVKLSFNDRTPPFSDLNHHSIRIVPAFRAESGDSFVVQGVTLSSVDFSLGHFVDSDIIIFATNADAPYRGQSDQTIVHELGHFFGLGHEFSKTETGAALYESVMAYRHATENVSERDRQAIRALYGKDLGPTEP